MDLSILPLEIENIIMNYKYQLDHSIKYNRVMNQLKKTIKYEYIDFKRNDRTLYIQGFSHITNKNKGEVIIYHNIVYKTNTILNQRLNYRKLDIRRRIRIPYGGGDIFANTPWAINLSSNTIYCSTERRSIMERFDFMENHNIL